MHEMQAQQVSRGVSTKLERLAVNDALPFASEILELNRGLAIRPEAQQVEVLSPTGVGVEHRPLEPALDLRGHGGNCLGEREPEIRLAVEDGPLVGKSRHDSFEGYRACYQLHTPNSDTLVLPQELPKPHDEQE